MFAANASSTASRRHRSVRRVARDADVVVGDEREVRVTEAELAREPALRIGRHVDEIPAHRPEPGALGPRREARALDHDDRPAVVHRQAELARPRRAASRAGRRSRDRRRTRGAPRGRRRTCARGSSCDRRTGRRRRTSPARRSGRSEPAAHGATMRVTPTERSAQRFARYGHAMRRELVLGPWRGRKAVGTPPTLASAIGADAGP